MSDTVGIKAFPAMVLGAFEPGDRREARDRIEDTTVIHKRLVQVLGLRVQDHGCNTAIHVHSPGHQSGIFIIRTLHT
jgi:hypothetical protein